MRWMPTVDRCPECGFDWHCGRPEAAGVVQRAPSTLAGLAPGVDRPSPRPADGWSAPMYLWHLVDVLRIGTERLVTLVLDPEAGILCWDENELAACRKYDALSPRVGLEMMRRVVREWSEAAAGAPDDAVVVHPQFGSLGALDIMRRNAHEVHHHTWDIRRLLGAPPEG